MTTRTSNAVQCECGRVGSIVLSENDQPYSRPSERYSPRGLKGNGFVCDRFANWPEIFSEMNLRCMDCDKKLTPENLV